MESNEFTFVWSICKFSERPEKTGQFFPSQQFVINGPDEITMITIMMSTRKITKKENQQ